MLCKRTTSDSDYYLSAAPDYFQDYVHIVAIDDASERSRITPFLFVGRFFRGFELLIVSKATMQC
jgi:hypothetical protein